jgi:hypothetical protein
VVELMTVRWKASFLSVRRLGRGQRFISLSRYLDISIDGHTIMSLRYT